MSWFSDAEKKVAGAVEGIGEDLGLVESEHQAPPTQFTNQGAIPPVAVEQQMMPSAPTASQRAYGPHVEEEHVHRESGPEQPEKSHAWSDQSFVDPGYQGTGISGEQETKNTGPITKEQIYDAITAVAPSLPHAFKCLLVGHAWVEQKGTNIINWNYAGVEGGAKATCLAWTSADIGKDEVLAHRGTKYRDWGGKSIDKQLQENPERKTLIVMVQKPRPAYGSLNDATAEFVRLIEHRVRMLEASSDPDHRLLAEAALGGDSHAYAQIVSKSYVFKGDKDKNGRDKRFGAYNGHANYGPDVEDSIKKTQGELAGKEG